MPAVLPVNFATCFKRLVGRAVKRRRSGQDMPGGLGNAINRRGDRRRPADHGDRASAPGRRCRGEHGPAPGGGVQHAAHRPRSGQPASGRPPPPVLGPRPPGVPDGAAPVHGASAGERLPDLASLTGPVNLTMPASAWLAGPTRPDEVAGSGPVDADACRDLAHCARSEPGPATSGCRRHLAGLGDDPPAGARQMRLRTSGSVVPARPDAAAPDRHPPPDLRGSPAAAARPCDATPTIRCRSTRAVAEATWLGPIPSRSDSRSRIE